MNKIQVLDEYFIEARAHALELAAFIDRLRRAGGESDFRGTALSGTLDILSDDQPDKTRRMLERLSDPTTEPLDAAPGKGASGAWPGDHGREA